MTKQINPAVLPDFKEALALTFWFKKDLRNFVSACLSNDPLLVTINWEDYKRNIVENLINEMVDRQQIYLEKLIDLMLSLADIDDPHWLKRVEDGESKYREAVKSLQRLRSRTEPYRKNRSQIEEAERRSREQSVRAAERMAIQTELDQLKNLMMLITTQSPQERGYSLEQLLDRLFSVLDITARKSFRAVGEQIDGSFSLDHQDYLVEAKWTNDKVGLAILDTFAGKVGRKLDNTLGLMISMNGFEETAISQYSQRRSTIILMDGSDLYAVLDGRVELAELLDRKRRHASQTGEVFFPVSKMLVD